MKYLLENRAKVPCNLRNRARKLALAYLEIAEPVRKKCFLEEMKVKA
jgi:hypothetical protein